ncbi:MAG: response regulator transcription factor [Prevotella sp.]|nr:response regulator transcription factor [Prevotella sp.]
MSEQKEYQYANLSIAIIDDHEAILEGINSFLKKQGVGRVDVFTSPEGLSDAMSSTRYDVYVIDVELKEDTGLSMIGMIRAKDAEAKILIYTMHEEVWIVREIQNKDVNGVLYKSAHMDEVLEAINALLAGRTYYSKKFRQMANNILPNAAPLSKREAEVLKKIAQGYSSKDIAKLLFISENTVETHRRNLFAKLQANNVADLIVKAIARGYIDVSALA